MDEEMERGPERGAAWPAPPETLEPAPSAEGAPPEESRAPEPPRPAPPGLRQPEPREVVEYYVPSGREVVAYYVSPRPLPRRRASAFQARRAQRRRRRKALWIALGSVLLLAASAAGALAWQHYVGSLPFGPGYTYDYGEGCGTVAIPTYPLSADARLDIVTERGEALTAQEIYQTVNPSVVTVMVQLEGTMSVGTGVIFTEDGYVLTNFHVVEDGTACTVTLEDNTMYDAKYVAGDKDNDIAVLKVEPRDPLPAAVIGDSDALSVGDKVYAIGNPLGLELRGTFTDGIVSAINRDVWVDGRRMTLVQTNAALNSGNSGGPLISVYGQVVGINTVKMSSQYSTIEGLGFALPTSSIAYLVNDLVATGEIQPESELGVKVLAVARELPDGSWGLPVVSVTPGSGADEAGIRKGDFIVQANGEDTTTSAALLRIRRDLHAGDTLVLRVWRDGEVLDLPVVLQEKTPEKG